MHINKNNNNKGHHMPKRKKEQLTYNQPHRCHQPTKSVSWDISADFIKEKKF